MLSYSTNTVERKKNREKRKEGEDEGRKKKGKTGEMKNDKEGNKIRSKKWQEGAAGEGGN